MSHSRSQHKNDKISVSKQEFQKMQEDLKTLLARVKQEKTWNKFSSKIITKAKADEFIDLIELRTTDPMDKEQQIVLKDGSLVIKKSKNTKEITSIHHAN